MNYASILAQQKQFFLSGATRNLSFRKETLLKLSRIIHQNEKQIYDAIYNDFHKSEFDTYATELSIIYSEIRYYTKNLKKLAKSRRKPTNLANIPGRFFIHPEPLGNTLIIGAWNYPYQLTLLPMISAIAAGNTCIIKPSELPSKTMQIIAELINTNFNANFLYVATGGVEETSTLLQLHYDKIFFTGSPNVGKIIYQAAAQHLTPITLELGGKSPVIVTSHANLEIAAKRIVWGKFLNAGQTCVAPDYIYVEESVATTLLELIKKYIIQNDYKKDSSNYVHIINHRHFDRLIPLIDPDKIYYGGTSNKDSLFIEPTILTNISWNDPVMQEEVFGPILPIITYTKLNSVFQDIQHHEKPLAAYLFSNNAYEQQEFLTNISFGGGCINDTIMHLANNNVPFGGVGNSGIGNYHGQYGFDCFTHYKTIFKKPLFGEPNLKYPPYTSKKLKWIKRLM